MTRPTKCPRIVAALLATACLVNTFLFVAPNGATAAVRRPAHVATKPRARTCHRDIRSVAELPRPRVGFEAPYVPSACDPLRLLPKQAYRLFACVRWHEGGDNPSEPNGAGMYQFTNRATWNEFRGSFPKVPSHATALEQDIVAYRTWRTEQFLPWDGDPCLGSERQYGKWGWY